MSGAARTFALLTVFSICLVISAGESNATQLPTDAAGASGCVSHTGASGGSGSITAEGTNTCNSGTPNSDLTSSKPVIKVVDCGPPQVAGHLQPTAGGSCAVLANVCA